jgi:UTP--glucose-1-phosphate uridylyltransferase
MAGIIEKPSPKDAPSNLGLVGSYIFTPEIFSHIAKLNPGTGGELQLTDGIQTLLKEQLVLALQYEGVRYDCGNKLGYRKATINLALKHQELKEDFRMYLENRKN